MRGLSFCLANFANLLYYLFPFFERIPVKFMSLQIENMVTLVSRTGRELQRYEKGSRLVVGCIPYRYKKKQSSFDGTLIEELEVLMISAQKGQAMLFPKGGWELDESMEQAALRETIEEAGVIGDIERKLGKWRYKSKSQGIIHDAYMFPLLVKKQLDIWPEKSIRNRRWMTVKEARESCKNWWMRDALDEFVHRKNLS
ncbi:nudix hydrolase 18, mitochondrial [Carica papaya]|uniref:nudix hydrolase 18, mitochondrial n=1 Tax=Carica papaya TaxID=3649 RepID=UPI000B8C8A36|nr:nudix hydrolase 18, mitochondrial [Carica papaya]